MAEVSKDKRAELEAEHGEIYVHEATGTVYRCPNRTEMRFFINATARSGGRGGDFALAVEGLVLNCVIYPDRDTANQIFERKPGVPMVVVDQLQKLAGLEPDDPKL